MGTNFFVSRKSAGDREANKTITRSCLGVAEQDNILARVAKN